ncbi:acyl-CoA thioesterase [Alteromonas facilis]|uniref:acyl-CoA thioesterase n=1 Tax=Alteromonas facilis TaxID=2048004 RepID=UPI000C2855C4|nr:thioesterase family protein [Alteromonas facilis]
MTAHSRPQRLQFHRFLPIVTRWSDNDIYGHINNVVYYSYFDSAVNRFLIEEGGLDIHNSDTVAYVVNSHCDYYAPLAYPQSLEIGLRVAKLGNSSVTYELGVFAEGHQTAAALGRFVHVFVDRVSDKSVPIPANIRAALELLQSQS